MAAKETFYILGAGAIGFPLAVCLAHAGRRVVAVRTSTDDVPDQEVEVEVHTDAGPLRAVVETVSLSRLVHVDGTIVITAKSYANQTLARKLMDKSATGPMVIMQNGVGVERAFSEAGFSPIYRCILYVTSQAQSAQAFTFRPVASSPIGIVDGDGAGLAKCVAELSTEPFRFHAEANIQREIWNKAVINAVFNSICPLLEVDNGVFARNPAVAGMARELVAECIALTDRLGLALGESELMARIMQISQRSDGQLISTLQDIRRGRPTEMDALNLEMARVGAAMHPALQLPKVELLGRMVAAKSLRHSSPQG